MAKGGVASGPNFYKIQFNMGYICPQTLHQSELIAVNDCEIYKMDLLKRYKLNLASNTWIPTWMVQPTNRCFQLWQQRTVESRLNLIDLLSFQPMEAKVLETTCYTWYWRNESWVILNIELLNYLYWVGNNINLIQLGSGPNMTF